MLGKILSIPIAIIKDVATLGGGINDGYFSNGNRTYTGKLINQISAEAKLKEDIRTVASIAKELKKLMIIILFIGLSSCSSLRLKTDHGWFGPDVYKLTDGEISVHYYDGNCCCIAKEVLEELRNRVNSGKVNWHKFADKKFADEYLKNLCAEMLNDTK